MNATSRLVQLAGRIVGAVPRFDRAGQRMVVTLYRLLSEAEPVPIGRLAAVLDMSEDAVRTTLDCYPVFMVVGPTGVRDITPATAVVSFLTPDRSFDRNVIVNFCHFVHFFRTAEAGAEWIAQRPGTFLLTVEEAFSLGQLTNTRNFGDVLRVSVAQSC